jgi:hypothetical protein
MKKYLSLFLTIFLLLITPAFTFAQDSSEAAQQTQVDENTTKITNNYFDLTLTEGFQSPLDKSITYTLTVVPHINSDKTQIIWSVPASFSSNANNNSFVSLTAETTYTYKVKVKPTVSGSYNITVSVISWQYDTNYTNSISDDITLNNSLVSTPVSEVYIFSTIAEALVILGLSALAIWGGIKFTKQLMVKAKKWLTPPV